MKYFKVDISIVEGQKKYGNLPEGFVLGYENNHENKSYFILHEDVSIPEDSDINEISEETYNQAVKEIMRIENEKKQAELEETIKFIEEKNQRFKTLEEENILLKAQNNALTDRTDFHEEVLTEIILTISP